MLLDKAKIETLHRLIEQSENVVVVSHVNPDGDALGSAMGLRAALAKRGKNVTAMLPSVYPDYFGFLPAAESIIVDEKEHDRCVEAIANADLIILADLNQLKRTDKLAETIRQSTAPKVLIDHHPNPETEPMTVFFSDTEISSASELAYWVVCRLYGNAFVDKEMATCFYTGICTDTGSFSFSCNHRSVYEAVGNMVET
ncbi:MAG: DHH family phosphoesterase, partial [Bacteroidales bacterium]|nr:DHH family phosphoesterase [Bacteroidales bacterium]